MYAREIASPLSLAERRERRHTFVTSDPFDEQFFRLRRCRYKYLPDSGECHFVVSDLDLDAWRPAKERFVQTVAEAAVQKI